MITIAVVPCISVTGKGQARRDEPCGERTISELLAPERGCASEASRSSFPLESGFGMEGVIPQSGCSDTAAHLHRQQLGDCAPWRRSDARNARTKGTNNSSSCWERRYPCRRVNSPRMRSTARRQGCQRSRHERFTGCCGGPDRWMRKWSCIARHRFGLTTPAGLNRTTRVYDTRLRGRGGARQGER